MSPEQVGGNEYDEKCDIWSLGCILYEMATLTVPFKAENYLALASVITECKKKPIPDKYSDDLAK
jgi:NIMA (never in mitosis gene a)-related kinase